MSGKFKDQLIVCLLSISSICLFLDLLRNTQVWKQVCLLDLAQLAVQGGLGHYGAIGGPDFFPNKVIAISDSKLHLDVNSLLAQCNMAGLCTIVEVTYYRNGPATTNLHDM